MADYESVQLVRTLTADPDTPTAPGLVPTVDLERLLDLNGGDARLAAADALDMVATSEVLISKKITSQDVTTDGPAVAAALRAQANHLRGISAALAAVAADDEWSGLVIVP